MTRSPTPDPVLDFRADSALADITQRLELLLLLTPVNSVEAWDEFAASGYTKEPRFTYRPIPFDPEEIREEVRDAPIDEVDDPAIAQLLMAKQRELEAALDLVAARDRDGCLDISVKLYGDVTDKLYRAALAILDQIPAAEESEPRVTAFDFAARATDEVEFYRRSAPDLACEVQVRDDVVDLMVSHGDLLIGASSMFRQERVEALIEHEVGTHVLTYHNATAQPLRILRTGLDGYEETQEGLALVAEHVVGGLDPERLRLLAGRVLGVRRVLEGHSFLEVFEELHSGYGFFPRSAWSVTSRVARSGGFTKDAIYLRGLLQVREHIKRGREFDPLLIGKMSLVHVPLIDDLMDRRILGAPTLIPRWLERKDLAARLDELLGTDDLCRLVNGRAA